MLEKSNFCFSYDWELTTEKEFLEKLTKKELGFVNETLFQFVEFSNQMEFYLQHAQLNLNVTENHRMYFSIVYDYGTTHFNKSIYIEKSRFETMTKAYSDKDSNSLLYKIVDYSSWNIPSPKQYANILEHLISR